MTERGLFMATLCVSLLNGLVSPAVQVLFYIVPLWFPVYLPMTRETVFYAASLVVSTATLLAAGIPAALFERLMRPAPGATMPGWIWLVCAIALTLPGIAVRW